jgi:formate/nitrite transporter FocA (FNT family)
MHTLVKSFHAFDREKRSKLIREIKFNLMVLAFVAGVFLTGIFLLVLILLPSHAAHPVILSPLAVMIIAFAFLRDLDRARKN